MFEHNSARKKPLILLVDDNPKNIQLLGTLIRIEIDCDQAIAMNGREALEQAKAVNPDLILLDVMMPEMDGYEACAKLKADPAMAGIPVIFLTAKTQPEDVVHGFKAGAVDYVSKPFQSAELLARVRTQLKIKEGRDTIQRQNDERKQLLHVLCHDLANPFASMISCLDMINDGDSFLKLKNSLLDTATNGLNLIDMVRRIRSLEEKGIADLARPVELLPLVMKAQILLQQRFSAKNVSLAVAVPAGVVINVEEVSFVNSVLNNLLSNAIKFSSSGSTVSIDALQTNETVIRIIDSGIGMPPEILNHLFDIRKMTSRPGTAGETGTGFGMPLVRRFVESAGGSIKVESRDIVRFPDDHGTVVTLTLPLV